jgi:predicted DNA-binding transcriptional regulator AlpA
MVIKSIDELPEVITPKQVAAWLQISLVTVYDFANKGGLPHFRLCRPGSISGRGILRFRKVEVLRWWERQREGKAA